MVSELVKGHELWRFSDMSRSSLRRGEKWGGSKGVGDLLLDGLCGVTKEENLDEGGLGIFRAVVGVLNKGWEVVVL